MAEIQSSILTTPDNHGQRTIGDLGGLNEFRDPRRTYQDNLLGPDGLLISRRTTKNFEDHGLKTRWCSPSPGRPCQHASKPHSSQTQGGRGWTSQRSCIKQTLNNSVLILQVLVLGHIWYLDFCIVWVRFNVDEPWLSIVSVCHTVLHVSHGAGELREVELWIIGLNVDDIRMHNESQFKLLNRT